MNINYDVISFISKCIYFKKTKSSHFAYIIKILTSLLKQFLNTPKMLKALEIMYQNAVYICIS